MYLETINTCNYIYPSHCQTQDIYRIVDNVNFHIEMYVFFWRLEMLAANQNFWYLSRYRPCFSVHKGQIWGVDYAVLNSYETISRGYENDIVEAQQLMSELWHEIINLSVFFNEL